MKVIGIDPSLTATGIAAIDLEDCTIIDWDCIRTKPSPNEKKMHGTARRIFELRQGLRAFQSKHNGLTAIEGQVPSSMGKNNSVSSFGKGLAYGVAMGTTEAKPIVLTPWEMRSRLELTPSASKEDMWEKCLAELRILDGLVELRSKPAREAVHDAVAVALSARTEVLQLRALIG